MSTDAKRKHKKNTKMIATECTEDTEGNYEGAKVSSSNANYLWRNGVEANNMWHANFISGDVLKVQLKTLKAGDAIMILYTPRGKVLKRVMVV